MAQTTVTKCTIEMVRNGYSASEGTYRELAKIDCSSADMREVEIKLASMIRDGWNFRPRSRPDYAAGSGRKPSVEVTR